eukprot:1282835-Pyramimonas_sp.AAC.1
MGSIALHMSSLSCNDASMAERNSSLRCPFLRHPIISSRFQRNRLSVELAPFSSGCIPCSSTHKGTRSPGGGPRCA